MASSAWAQPAGIAAGSAVELEPCAHQTTETWSTFFGFYGWAGQPLSATRPGDDPGEAMILSGATASGGQVSVANSPGTPDWYTSEDWTEVEYASGFEIQSFYDPDLCLDAPDTVAGTQLTVAPCVGGQAQTFYNSGSVGALGFAWWLRATTSPRMCVAVGAPGSSAGLPLVLQACSLSQDNEAWLGPYGL